MSNKNLVSTLEEIQKLVDRALKQVGENTGVATVHTKKTSVSGSLPDLILGLRANGFFKQPKTAKEVHAELESNYPCEPDRVNVALLRLLKRKQLRKVNKLVGDKKTIAYVG